MVCPWFIPCRHATGSQAAWLTPPSPLQVGQVSTPTANVAQALAKTTEAQKLEDCAGMLVEEQTQASGSGQRMPLTIIFVERKARCDDVAELLRSEGLQALALHGGLSQGDREHALREFTAGNAQVRLCRVGRLTCGHVATTLQNGCSLPPAGLCMQRGQVMS